MIWGRVEIIILKGSKNIMYTFAILTCIKCIDYIITTLYYGLLQIYRWISVIYYWLVWPRTDITTVFSVSWVWRWRPTLMGSPCGPNNKEKLRKKSLANMIQILVVLTISIMLVFHPSAVLLLTLEMEISLLKELVSLTSFPVTLSCPILIKWKSRLQSKKQILNSRY